MPTLLPIYKPLFRGFLHHAYPFALFDQSDEKLKKWVLCNYLQLFYNGSPTQLHPILNFYLPYNVIHEYSNHPLVKTRTIAKELILPNPLDFTKNALERGHYVFAYANEYWLPFSEAYQEYDFIHDMLIYGFDEQDRQFFVFVIDANRSFISSTISFEQYVSSLEAAVPDLVPEYSHHFDDINLLKINQNANYEFDLDLVISLLTDYLYANNTSVQYSMVKNRGEFLYGMDVYQILYDFEKIDHRAFHIFWEHKKCVVLTIEYIIDIYGIELSEELENYRLIEQKAIILRNLILKYQISMKDTLRGKSIVVLDQLKEMERNTLGTLLNKLSLHAK